MSDQQEGEVMYQQQEQPNQEYQQLENEDASNEITQKIKIYQGGLYGGLLGSAIGGRNRFLENPNEQETFRALALDGGGVHELAPGQLSDQGELILQVAEALSIMIYEQKYDLNILALHIVKWLSDDTFKDSREFLNTYTYFQENNPEDSYVNKLIRTSEKLQNFHNSAAPLVGFVPFALFIQPFPVEIYDKLVADYVLLFTPSKNSYDICLFYAILIKYLVEFNGQLGTAYGQARGIFSTISQNEQLESWLNMVELGQYEKILSIPANEIQVPFLIALFTALKGNDYLAGLTYPLSEGNDTSVSCTVTGSLIGLILNFSNLPDELIAQIQIFKPDAPDVAHQRPAERNAYFIQNYLLALINDFHINNVYVNIWESIRAEMNLDVPQNNDQGNRFDENQTDLVGQENKNNSEQPVQNSNPNLVFTQNEPANSHQPVETHQQNLGQPQPNIQKEWHNTPQPLQTPVPPKPILNNNNNLGSTPISQNNQKLQNNKAISSVEQKKTKIIIQEQQQPQSSFLGGLSRLSIPGQSIRFISLGVEHENIVFQLVEQKRITLLNQVETETNFEYKFSTKNLNNIIEAITPQSPFIPPTTIPRSNPSFVGSLQLPNRF